MFTGLIEETGRLGQVLKQGDSARLQIEAPAMAPELVLGESVAVDGACLTVEERLADGFSAFASSETLSCTTLGQMAVGQAVNLERALRVGDRLGGHLVAGHVDATGALIALESRDEGWLLRVKTPSEILRVSVAKGSVAVDGISLTLVDVGTSEFTVAVIPETYRATTLHLKKPGDPVNLESDTIGKYVARAMSAHGAAPSSARPPATALDLLLGSPAPNRK